MKVDIHGHREIASKLRGWVLVLAILTLLVATTLLLASISFDDSLGFAAIGLALTAISWLPFAVRDQQFLSLWGFVSLSVTGAAGIRGIMIALRFPSDLQVDAMFLRGATFAELRVPAAITLAIMIGLTGGVLIAGQRNNNPGTSRGRQRNRKLLRVSDISEPWIVFVSFAYALIGAVATYAYYSAVGGLDAHISARRTTVPGINPTDTFQSFGHLEILGQAGQIGFVMLLYYWLKRRARVGLLRGSLLVLLLANAVALNVITTTREAILRLGLITITGFCLARGRVPVRATVAVGLVAVLGIAALSSERSGDSTSEQSWLGVASESIFLNRNSFDLGKTLLIMEAVPDRLPLQYGNTLAAYLTAPVPRALWPQKPIISPGLTIGRSLYGTTLTGVPPGMAAELVWNFGALAAILTSVFVGLGLGVLDRRRYPQDGEDLLTVLTYLLVVLNFGQDLVGTAIGASVVIAATYWAMLIPLRYLAGVSTGSTAPTPAPRLV